MPYADDLDVRVTDTTLRDGSHAVHHQFTEEDITAIVTALDAAGVSVIEVSHGDGLGAARSTTGFSRTDERLLMAAAVRAATRAKIGHCSFPGWVPKPTSRRPPISACPSSG